MIRSIAMVAATVLYLSTQAVPSMAQGKSPQGGRRQTVYLLSLLTSNTRDTRPYVRMGNQTEPTRIVIPQDSLSIDMISRLIAMASEADKRGVKPKAEGKPVTLRSRTVTIRPLLSKSSQKSAEKVLQRLLRADEADVRGIGRARTIEVKVVQPAKSASTTP
jgi:hypothetical protein